MNVEYDEVYVYSMGRPNFILQHVVDAFGVQSANVSTKPIAIVFGLVGLYLHTEKKFTGNDVQKTHRELARRKREWPRLPLPADRGNITVADVLAAQPGPDRDLAIDNWCHSVWTACAANRDAIIALLREYRLIA